MEKIKREELQTIIIDQGDQSLHGTKLPIIHKWYMLNEFHSMCTICGMVRED